MMVLAQANRKHRYVLSPLNECVNIVALILYLVFTLLRSILFLFLYYYGCVCVSLSLCVRAIFFHFRRDVFEMVAYNE